MASSQLPSPIASTLGGLLPSATTAGRVRTEAAVSANLFRFFLNAAERSVDIVAIVAAIYCSYALYRLLGAGSQAQYPPSAALLSAAAFALLFVILFERHGGYRSYVSLLAVRDTERILRVTVESFLLALLVAYFTTEHVSRLVVVLAVFTVPLFVTFCKLGLYDGMELLRSKGYGARKAVIVGAGPLGRRIYSALVRSPKCGLDPVAFVDDKPEMQGAEIYESSYQRKRATKVIAGPVCPELLRELDASVLILAMPGADRELTVRTGAAAGVDTYCVREDVSEPGLWIDHANFDGVTLAHYSTGQTRILGDLAKRAIDLVASTMLLATLAPLFAILTVLVKKSSAGPVFFRQDRVGRNGRLFSIYKFRTMYCDAPQYSYSPGAGDDPRVTPTGRFLRRTSLDELPQFLNVVLGQMSLVGPRPEMPFIVEQYTPLQRRRLEVRPGMTGLWQLSADRAFPIHENPEYDLYYLANNPRFLWGIALQFSGLKRFEVN
jgi:exopolysaccharide biosynthesis polyprenyl glycosylphosphotransferase